MASLDEFNIAMGGQEAGQKWVESVEVKGGLACKKDDRHQKLDSDPSECCFFCLFLFGWRGWVVKLRVGGW